jgi:hypothetical protein
MIPNDHPSAVKVLSSPPCLMNFVNRKSSLGNGDDARIVTRQRLWSKKLNVTFRRLDETGFVAVTFLAIRPNRPPSLYPYHKRQLYPKIGVFHFCIHF